MNITKVAILSIVLVLSLGVLGVNIWNYFTPARTSINSSQADSSISKLFFIESYGNLQKVVRECSQELKTVKLTNFLKDNIEFTEYVTLISEPYISAEVVLVTDDLVAVCGTKIDYVYNYMNKSRFYKPVEDTYHQKLLDKGWSNSYITIDTEDGVTDYLPAFADGPLSHHEIYWKYNSTDDSYTFVVINSQTEIEADPLPGVHFLENYKCPCTTTYSFTISEPVKLE